MEATYFSAAARFHYKRAGGKGLGVFATEAIPSGTLIEECPVLVISKAEEDAMERHFPGLWDYELGWALGTDDAPGALALGYLSLYNHSADPSTRLERDFEKRTVRVYAKRDIAAGEELTFFYQCPLWFEPAP